MNCQNKKKITLACKPRVLVLLALLLFAGGCSRAVTTTEPVRIVSSGSPLKVKLNDDVNWTFKAYRGSRELVVMEILPMDVPLGVVRDFKASVPTFSGKVLTRDVRHGVMRVLAFDEAACNQAYEGMKKATESYVKTSKDTNVAIPVSPCSRDTISPQATSPEFLSYGYVTWHMTDGPDEIASEEYGAFFNKNFESPSKLQIRTNLLSIPENEAPHTVDVWLGACAAKDRRFCGSHPDCLWGRFSCISKDATGAKSLNNSNDKGKI